MLRPVPWLQVLTVFSMFWVMCDYVNFKTDLFSSEVPQFYYCTLAKQLKKKKDNLYLCVICLYLSFINLVPCELVAKV